MHFILVIAFSSRSDANFVKGPIIAVSHFVQTKGFFKYFKLLQVSLKTWVRIRRRQSVMIHWDLSAKYALLKYFSVIASI